MLKVRELSPAEFDSYARNQHPESNFLQSADWGKVYEIDGEKCFYLGLVKDKQILGAALLVLKRAKRGAYLEIPGGPLLNWRNTEQTSTMLRAIKELAKTENCVFVRMRPNIPDSPDQRRAMKEYGLHESPMHLHAEHTVMLDLTKSEDTLMAEMRRQTRYEVRRAQKLGITVSSTDDKQAFEAFYHLQEQTAARQGFIQSPRSFIMAQQAAFNGKAKIYSASLDGKTLAQGLIILQKPEAVYNEAASTPDGRKLPGAYALQWQVIRDAKAAGMTRYNLFGIAPPNSPHHRYAGVTTFKTGFGGEKITYLPAQDLVVKPMRYQFVRIIESIRKHRRKLG